jgi:hypothetical protein
MVQFCVGGAEHGIYTRRKLVIYANVKEILTPVGCRHIYVYVETTTCRIVR